MTSASIDTIKFKAHSTRSAVAASQKKSMSLDQILKCADWSNARTFMTFYDHQVQEEAVEVSAVLPTTTTLEEAGEDDSTTSGVEAVPSREEAVPSSEASLEVVAATTPTPMRSRTKRQKGGGLRQGPSNTSGSKDHVNNGQIKIVLKKNPNGVFFIKK